MNIEKEYHQEKHELQLTVETAQEPFEKAKALAARAISKEVDIPGFRPGKAPYSIVVRHVGEARIIDNALESFLDEIYPQVLEELDEKPYGPGRLKEIHSLEPPTLEFVIPLQPEVELGDYHSLRIPYEPEKVTEQDVQEVVDDLRSDQAEVGPVEHPAEEGNIVTTKITGYPVDADPEDEEAQIMTNQPLPVMVKEETEENKNEWPFPGFSRQLLGSSPGDTLELVHEYADHEEVDEELRGKEILFDVTVEEIKDQVLPELNDAFVKSIDDEFETVDELLEDIRASLEEQIDEKNQNEYINQILEAIEEISTVRYPDQLLQNEINGEIEELKDRIQGIGMDMDTYLAMREMDEEELREQIKPQAIRRIVHGLIITHISEEEDLDISADDVTGRFQETINMYFGEEDSESKQDFLGSQNSIELLNRISNQMVTEVTLNYLQALAKGEDTSSFMKQEEADEEEDAAEDAEEENELEETEPSSEETPEEEILDTEPEEETSDGDGPEPGEEEEDQDD